MKRTSPRSVVMLLATAMIWGSSFVAQSVSMKQIGPFTFNAARSLLAGVCLIPAIFLLDGMRGEEERAKLAPSNWAEWKELLVAGLCCGLALGAAASLQQLGIVYTTASKASFLTTLYVVIVPFLGVIFLKQKLPRIIWVCVALALAGLYQLSMSGPMGLELGDSMILLCAAAYAVHILVAAHFSPKVDPVRMSCIQFFTCSIVSCLLMLLTEQPDVNAVLSVWQPIAYAGILSSAVAYTFQVVAQKNCDPTVASLLLSLESVFGALFGSLLLHERLGTRELRGCGLILSAIVLAQIPEEKWKKWAEKCRLRRGKEKRLDNSTMKNANGRDFL